MLQLHVFCQFQLICLENRLHYVAFVCAQITKLMGHDPHSYWCLVSRLYSCMQWLVTISRRLTHLLTDITQTLYIKIAIRNDKSQHLLQATDADEGENAVMSFAMAASSQSMPFFVHGSDGVIYTSRTFNASSQKKYTLKVAVENPDTPIGHKMRSPFIEVIVSECVLPGNLCLFCTKFT